MSSSTFTSKEYFRMLTLLFYVLLAGQIVLLGTFFLIGQSIGNIGSAFDGKNLFIAVAIASWGVLFFISKKIATIHIEKIKTMIDLREKLAKYRSLTIIRLTLAEASTIITTILYFISGDQIMLGLAILMIALFIGNKPSKEKIIASLELNPLDQMRLENSEEIIAEVEISTR